MKNKAKDRVAIAKDALAWEEAGALIPTEGVYLNPCNNPDPDRYLESEQARNLNLGKCQVCALGGLLVARAVRFDKVTYYDILYKPPYDLLTEYFTLDQLRNIECAFEDFNDLRTWKEDIPDATERFKAIMQNIIDNKGTFVP